MGYPSRDLKHAVEMLNSMAGQSSVVERQSWGSLEKDDTEGHAIC